MSGLPREAREGLMRAWLKVLCDRDPSVTWIPVQEAKGDPDERAEVETSVSK